MLANALISVFLQESTLPVQVERSDNGDSGSAGSMEASGVAECFQSSIQNRMLRYTQLIWDGDSKTHQSILTVDLYSGTPVEKLECIRHIQKQIGSRLRNLRSKHKEKLSDGKGISVHGRLTEKMINKLQNLYGIVLRQNVKKTVHKMKVAIGAVLYTVQNSRKQKIVIFIVYKALTHSVNTGRIK